MVGVEVRLARISDFEVFEERFGVFDLEKNVGTPDPVKILKEEFELESRSQFVAVEGGRILGFASVSEHEPGRMHLRHLMVSDDARGRGVSGLLVNTVLGLEGVGELHIWTEAGRYPDFSDPMGFRVVESETTARYAQRIAELDLTHDNAPSGWEIRQIEEEDIDDVVSFLAEEGVGDELTDYEGNPLEEDGRRKAQAYLRMVCEEFAERFLLCFDRDRLVGLVFGLLSLDLEGHSSTDGTRVERRGWVQWLIASKRLSPDQRRRCFSALLNTLVRRMERRGALWFEALLDPTDGPLSDALDLLRLDILDQHRLLHMIGTRSVAQATHLVKARQ